MSDDLIAEVQNLAARTRLAADVAKKIGGPEGALGHHSRLLDADLLDRVVERLSADA